MRKNLLIESSQKFAADIDFLCRELKGEANIVFQIKKSSSSIFANIAEANYGHSLPDMLSKFRIALKECNETERWLRHLYDIGALNEPIFKSYRNACGRMRRMLIASCKTIEDKIQKE